MNIYYKIKNKLRIFVTPSLQVPLRIGTIGIIICVVTQILHPGHFFCPFLLINLSLIHLFSKHHVQLEFPEFCPPHPQDGGIGHSCSSSTIQSSFIVASDFKNLFQPPTVLFRSSDWRIQWNDFFLDMEIFLRGCLYFSSSRWESGPFIWLLNTDPLFIHLDLTKHDLLIRSCFWSRGEEKGRERERKHGTVDIFVHYSATGSLASLSQLSLQSFCGIRGSCPTVLSPSLTLFSAPNRLSVCGSPPDGQWWIFWALASGKLFSTALPPVGARTVSL